MYEPRSNIASVVRASEVGLLSLLQEIDKVLVTPTSVRHRSNVREKLYQDPVVQQGSVVRDRSPARQPSQLAVPSSGMFKNPPVSDLEDVNQSSCASTVVEVTGVVHAASVIPAASVHQVSSSGFAPAPRVGVHWGSEVCEWSSPPPKRLSGNFHEGEVVDGDRLSSKDDYGEATFRASLFGAGP